jgi:hypothetical protein
LGNPGRHYRIQIIAFGDYYDSGKEIAREGPAAQAGQVRAGGTLNRAKALEVMK